MATKLSSADIKLIEDVKAKGNIPQHIAIIMDGNGRWAKNRSLPRAAGHQRGVESVRRIVEACAVLGVKILTLYTFSTENWNRPKDEVSTLMRLIVKSLKNETDELNKNNIRLANIGDASSLPDIVRNELEAAVKKTSANDKMILNLALSYSGRWELVEAVKVISGKLVSGKIKPEDITEETISNHLSTEGMIDPDLLIRSGGDFRISNFLLWQIAYSEIFISDVLWPDFKCKHLIDAVKDFQKRERRFGLVSEQLSSKHIKEHNDKSHSNKVAKA
ncbi:MAG: di-trans,poly-cis-decaprenylcistransferase [Ignavibacteriae bacterium HGW-Ignavibacteriae-3]|nr:MAG: di-trans,poly-cis-decaprenylcistransferase [Ignavibacteriae bacterium HGW-Ignavibacteriae-3]